MVAKVQVKLNVVDADGHYLEPFEGLENYIEPKYKDVAPRVVTRSDGSREWVGRDWIAEGSPGFLQGGGGFSREEDHAVKNLIGLQEDQNSYSNQQQGGTEPPHLGGVDGAARLQVLDEEGMDAAVMYPTKALCWIPDGDYHMALNKALNDWLADYCSTSPSRLFGTTNIIAIHDLEAACAEVRRCKEKHGFKAVFIRNALPNETDRWWSKDYDPFWATCQELDVAVGFHPFPGDTMYGAGRYFDYTGGDPYRMTMRGPFINPVDSMNTVMGLIIGGVTERFPKLRLGILESGGGWIGTLLERMDNRYEYMKLLPPDLKAIPSDYFKRNWWIAFDPDEFSLKANADFIGADRIIWGSDWPHPDAFYPGFLGMLNENLDGMTNEAKAGIRGRNAVAFYKLED